MASKPVVGLALSAEMCKKMFRIEDLDRLHALVSVRGPLPAAAHAEDYRKILSEAKVLITGWGTTRLTQPLLAGAPKLKLIAHSAGTLRGLIDDSLYDRGVRVVTAAGANAVSVAQYTVAMMVSMLKQVPWISSAYSRGDLDEVRKRRALARELMDISVGIIGASPVGREVVKLLRSYPGLTLQCHDPYLTPESAAELGVSLVSAQDACRCEVVSIHAPVHPEMNRVLNARLLALLPDHAVLINTTRGPVLDEEALAVELKRRPLYACLDVTDPEPPTPESPLRTAPNLILTPHVSGALHQACKDMGKLVVEETLRFLAGEKLQHEVTREMLPIQM